MGCLETTSFRFWKWMQWEKTLPFCILFWQSQRAAAGLGDRSLLRHVTTDPEAGYIRLRAHAHACRRA